MNELIERLRTYESQFERELADALEQQAQQNDSLFHMLSEAQNEAAGQAKQIEELTASVESLEFKISSVKAERDENMRIARSSIEELEAENTALREQTTELRARLVQKMDDCTKATKECGAVRAELAAAYETAETTERRQLARIEELMAQLAAAQKDAERYQAIKRWDGAVRDGESAANIRLYGLQGAAEEALLSANSEDLDTAIDAAIAKENEQ